MTELRSAKADYRLYYQGQFCFVAQCRDLDEALGRASDRPVLPLLNPYIENK